MFGGIGYAPGHPSRFAGTNFARVATLTVNDRGIEIRPKWFWRTANRLPTLRIPVDAIEFGVRS
jgi:hypothetical protein